MSEARLPNDKRVEIALTRLAETDEPFALAKARCEALTHKMKVLKAVAFSRATGTVAEREAESQACQEVQDALKEFEAAILDRETLASKRKLEELVIEVWRTVSANRRS